MIPDLEECRFPEDLLRGPLRRFETHRERVSGLGLAMVGCVAEDLGGRLVLGNRTAWGARIRIELPAPAHQAEEEATAVTRIGS